jgi:hypothetical protein
VLSLKAAYPRSTLPSSSDNPFSPAFDAVFELAELEQIRQAIGLQSLAADAANVVRLRRAGYNLTSIGAQAWGAAEKRQGGHYETRQVTTNVIKMTFWKTDG